MEKKKHINKPLIIVKKYILKKYKNLCSIYDNHNEQQNNAHENKKQDIKIIKYKKESKKNVSCFFFFPRICFSLNRYQFKASSHNTILKSDWLYSLEPMMEKLSLYSKQKQDQELTVAQNSLLPNSDWNGRK